MLLREGAGALTFEELVKESGITRGGITYHFPTKEDLLRGLLESDFRQWDDAEAALTPTDCDPDTARLLAGCPCRGGCPSCVQSPKCGNLNEYLDKAAARTLLERMLAA